MAGDIVHEQAVVLAITNGDIKDEEIIIVCEKGASEWSLPMIELSPGRTYDEGLELMLGSVFTYKGDDLRKLVDNVKPIFIKSRSDKNKKITIYMGYLLAPEDMTGITEFNKNVLDRVEVIRANEILKDVEFDDLKFDEKSVAVTRFYLRERMEAFANVAESVLESEDDSKEPDDDSTDEEKLAKEIESKVAESGSGEDKIDDKSIKEIIKSEENKKVELPLPPKSINADELGEKTLDGITTIIINDTKRFALLLNDAKNVTISFNTPVKIDGKIVGRDYVNGDKKE